MENKPQEVTRKTVTSNLMWRFLERFGVYIVSFVISVVLARILEPATYGVVALMTVVITFLDVFVTGGFANSLIHDKEATEKDFNTLLVFNVLLSVTLYLVLFFGAPFFAAYYGEPILTGLVRVSGLTLLISGVKSLQYAYVAKRLEFKKFFFATIGGTIFSGILGVSMALLGFGAWALVVQGVVNHTIDSLILWFAIRWRPKIEFAPKLFWKHFSFGWKVLLYKIIYNISNNVRQLVIGKRYSAEDLSFYNRGKTYPNIIGQNITNAVNSVMYPVLAKTQDDTNRFNDILAKTYKTNAFVMLPLCAGLFCTAESFIHLLIGAKWLPCVPYIRIFCVVIFFNSVEAFFSNGPMALGKSTATMVLGILECVLSILLLIVAIPFGVMAIGYSMIVSSALNCLIYVIYLHVLTGFKTGRCVLHSLDSLLATVLMGAVVLALGLLPLPYYVLFFIQVVFGVGAYYFFSRLLKNESLDYCLSLVKEMLGKKKK